MVFLKVPMKSPRLVILVCLIATALLPACIAQVDAAPDPAPEPSCDPGSTSVRELLTPELVTSIDEPLAKEWGVTGCVQIPNEHGPGNLWCCWKDDAKEVP